MFNNLWQDLGRTARISLIAGVVIIAAITIALLGWLLRTDYQVLFANLAPQDAGAMVAELERLKIPYKLEAGGATILVDGEQVHHTRLKLMSKELPLQGTVGFELFNNADFGMTEFAQKINYQRALQGEITRTIRSLTEIETARVHLALPEEGMFKRAGNRVKASITLTIKQGQTLQPEQITGIQHLVAAAVTGILTRDVTIVDQRGVALTRNPPDAAELAGGTTTLDLKKETEAYLNRKVAVVLDRTFGEGQAIASVDVTLNMDQVRTTTEDVMGAPGKADRVATGVVVRERETLRDGAAPLDARINNTVSNSGATANSQREIEYQVGRRIEQISSVPGAIQKLHIVAVVRKSLDARQIAQLEKLILSVVGGSPERGDKVVVQAVDGLSTLSLPNVAKAGEAEATDKDAAAVPVSPLAEAMLPMPATPVVWGGLLLALFFALTTGLLLWRSRKRQAPLSDAEREIALAQLKRWVAQDPLHGGEPEALP